MRNKTINFKTNHLSKINFNSTSIQKEFKKVKEENEKILESSRVDAKRLSIRFEI